MPKLPSRITPENLAAFRSDLRKLSDDELAALKDVAIEEILNALRVPLGVQQRRVYEAVLRLQSARALEVARFLKQDKGHTHRRLQALVRKGLIQRIVHGEHIFYSPRIY